MKPLKIALIYHPEAICPKELRAAEQGLGEFRMFGVRCESINVEDNLANVKRGGVLKEAVCSSVFSLHPFDLCHSSFGEFVRELFVETDTLGLALTTSILLETRENGNFRRMGVSAHGIGGMLSISRLREVCHTEQKLEAIRLAVAHETGHIVGTEEHCNDKNCLMQENRNHMDFLERIVERNLKACMDCTDRIADGISKLAASLG